MDQSRSQIFIAELASQLQEFEIALGGAAEFPPFFGFSLSAQLVDQGIPRILKPGWVKNLEVVGVNSGSVTPAQSMTRQKDGQSSAGLKLATSSTTPGRSISSP